MEVQFSMLVDSIGGSAPASGLGGQKQALSRLGFFPMASTLLVLLQFGLYTRENDFPITWHWDEAGKVHQLTTGQWNFNHPQLLFVVYDLFAFSSSAGRSEPPQSTLRRGRTASAALACAATWLFGFLVYRCRGAVAGLLAIVLLGANLLLFELSHHLKEDTALLFGLGCVALAYHFFTLRRSLPPALILGLGCGVAASGKYVGLLTVPAAMVAAMMMVPRGRQIAALLAVGSGALIAFAALNYHAFMRPVAFARGLLGEMTHVATHHQGLVSGFGDPYHFLALIAHCSPLVLLLYSAQLTQIAFRRKGAPSEWIITLFPLVFLIMLQGSAVKGARYLLPVIVSILLASVILLAFLWQKHPHRLIRAAVVVVGILLVGEQLWRLSIFRQFVSHNSRHIAANWIIEHVPANLVFVQDGITGLSSSAPGECRVELPVDPRYPDDLRRSQQMAGNQACIPHRLEMAYMLTDRSLEEIRAVADYIITSPESFAEYFDPWKRVVPGPAGEMALRNKRFYQQLFAEGELVLQIPEQGPRGNYLYPEIRVYRIR
jgi:hypothetical protein